MSFVRSIFRPIACLLFTTALLAATAHAQQKTLVLVAHPVLAALATEITQGSSITLQRVVPDGTPPGRQTAFLTGRGAGPLQEAAAKADAVIALRSLWADDPLFPLARRSNIRIVEIDAARPLDGALPGLALHDDGNNNTPLQASPWLHAVNLGRMADIIATELGRLSPAAKPQLDAQLARIKRRLMTLSARSESELAAHDNLSVFSLSPRLSYLIAGFNLDPAGSDTREDAAWTADALQAFGTQLKSRSVTLVLHHREPPATVHAAIRQAGARLLVLSAEAGSEGKDPLGELEQAAARISQALARTAQ